MEIIAKTIGTKCIVDDSICGWTQKQTTDGAILIK